MPPAPAAAARCARISAIRRAGSPTCAATSTPGCPWLRPARSKPSSTSASACSLAIKEYAHALSDDAEYADKAARISALARDLSELLPQLVPALKDKLRPGGRARLAFHPPCTLQHGQRLRGAIEPHLRALGFDVRVAGTESHLCCGSAGTYSILQPELARSFARPQARASRGAGAANASCRPTWAAFSTSSRVRRRG